MHLSFLSVINSLSGHQGPDVQRQLDVPIRRSDNPENVPLHFFASELQLRGTEVAEQPHHDLDSQSILCWNGEVSDRAYHGVSPFFTSSADIRGDKGSPLPRAPLA